MKKGEITAIRIMLDIHFSYDMRPIYFKIMTPNDKMDEDTGKVAIAKRKEDRAPRQKRSRDEGMIINKSGRRDLC